MDCFFCNENLFTVELLQSHINLKHKEHVYFEIQCKHVNCFKKFQNVYSLIRHIKNTHTTAVATNNAAPSANSFETLDVDKTLVGSGSNLNVIDLENISNNTEDLSIENFKEIVFKSALGFVVKLYANRSLSRKMVHVIINDMMDMYVANSLNFMKKKFEKLDDLIKMMNIMNEGFNIFKSEHKTLKLLQELNLLIMPKSITIKSYLAPGTRKGKRVRIIRRSDLSIINLNSVLKNILELPGMFNALIENIKNKSNDESVVSFFTSTFWKSVILKYPGRILIPIAIYFDDLEINNPLGSRKGKTKIGATYLNIIGLPDEIVSTLENIILVQLNRYKDHQTLGNKKIFSHIIDQLKDLELNGILVKINGVEKRVYFILAYVMGDNLGLNTVTGFSKSFNAAHCCRICFVEKAQLKSLTVENTKLIRTYKNYEEHVKQKSHGVRQLCIFNELPSFHIVNNLSVDPMHDLLEGICRYDIAKILSHFIEKNYITIEILNERIQFFDSSHSKNIPTITENSLKSGEIIISSAEMDFLVRNLCILIGDLIPTNEQVWKLYLLLLKIVHFATVTNLTEEIINAFGNTVSSYLKLYLKIFKLTLKYKHHVLLHYPRVMKQFGSLKYMSCLRCERDLCYINCAVLKILIV